MYPGCGSRWLCGLMFIWIQSQMIQAAVISQSKIPLFNRKARSLDEMGGKIGCMDMASQPGVYWYDSTGINTVCGFYVIAAPNQLVQLEFLEFDISCETGLLATVDGWEIQNQVFPSESDHTVSWDQRYRTYCGATRPRGALLMGQNAALVQFLLPLSGSGFRVAVTFIDNPYPCNVVSMEADGAYTLNNFGQRVNCSVSFLYPEVIRLLTLDVGVTSESERAARETGIKACPPTSHPDRVEIMGGSGLDPTIMQRASHVCGLDSNCRMRPVPISCSHTVVRLVSSGDFYNSVTFRHNQLTDQMQQHGFTNCLPQL